MHGNVRQRAKDRRDGRAAWKSEEMIRGTGTTFHWDMRKSAPCQPRECGQKTFKAAESEQGRAGRREESYEG